MPLSADRQRERREEYRRLNPIQTPVQKRHCVNCDTLFVKNAKHKDHKFCKEACRKEFHKFGTAMGPIRRKLEQLISGEIDKRGAQMQSLIENAADMARKLEAMRKRIERIKKTSLEPKRKQTQRKPNN